MLLKKLNILNLFTFILAPLALLFFIAVQKDNNQQEEQLKNAPTEVSESYLNSSLSGQNLKEDPFENINNIPLEFHDQSFSSQNILDDKLNRIASDDFKIPENLKKRVGFWLDIYSKYSSRFILIHDQQRPWIVYRVVDVRDIYERPTNKFTKDANDKRLVKKNVEQVKKLLLKLSKRKNFNNLSTEEEKYVSLLSEIPGKTNKVYKSAALNLRTQRGQKNFFRLGLISGSKYFPEMESIFAKYDVPVEIIKLPLVESSFNEQAKSKVGASGVWQFMPHMGKKYLKVLDHVDERNSPIKATEAAAKLLKSNYKMLKSWPLAITAYNHGPGGLLKAKKILNTQDLNEIIDNYKGRRFSFASQNFYSEFLAALHVTKYQEVVFGTLDKHPPVAADTLKLRRAMRVKELAHIAGVTLEEIKLHNPDLRLRVAKRNPFLPAGYIVRLPIGSLERIEKQNPS